MPCIRQHSLSPTWLTRKLQLSSVAALSNRVITYFFFRYIERANIEELFFIIQTKSNAYRLKNYRPPDGAGLPDINAAWQELEKGEHQREIRLREELARLANIIVFPISLAVAKECQRSPAEYFTLFSILCVRQQQSQILRWPTRKLFSAILYSSVKFCHDSFCKHLTMVALSDPVTSFQGAVIIKQLVKLS